MPELACEALRAAANVLLHPATTRPQSITANGPGHLLTSRRDVGPAASCPGLDPTHPGQQGMKQAGRGRGGEAWLCAAPPPGCLGRTLGQGILGGRQPDEMEAQMAKGIWSKAYLCRLLSLSFRICKMERFIPCFTVLQISLTYGLPRQLAGFPHLPLHFNLLRCFVSVEA